MEGLSSLVFRYEWGLRRFSASAMEFLPGKNFLPGRPGLLSKPDPIGDYGLMGTLTFSARVKGIGSKGLWSGHAPIGIDYQQAPVILGHWYIGAYGLPRYCKRITKYILQLPGSYTSGAYKVGIMITRMNLKRGKWARTLSPGCVNI